MRPSRRIALLGLIIVAMLVALAALAFISSDALAWRARVVRAKLLGELPELPLADFVRWLAPDSPVYLGELAENPNVVSAVTNFLSGKESVERGALLYGASCSSCHGDGGRGKSGPDLVSFIGSNTDWTFFATVKWGRP